MEVVFDESQFPARAFRSLVAQVRGAVDEDDVVIALGQSAVLKPSVEYDIVALRARGVLSAGPCSPDHERGAAIWQRAVHGSEPPGSLGVWSKPPVDQ